MRPGRSGNPARPSHQSRRDRQLDHRMITSSSGTTSKTNAAPSKPRSPRPSKCSDRSTSKSASAGSADFSEGRSRLLAAKPVMSGSGCNFQRHCHRAIFVGVGFKFNDFIQAIHRIQRFQQPEPVVIDIIYAESEREIIRSLREKWDQHRELTANMTDHHQRVRARPGRDRRAVAAVDGRRAD